MRRLDDMLGAAKAASVASLLPNISTKATLPFGLSPHLRARRPSRRLPQRDGRQRLVVDLDQLGGIARLRLRLGDHECDAVADEARLSLCNSC